MTAIDSEDITEYRWVASNGKTKIGKKTEILFEETGVHTIKLEVTDKDGNWFDYGMVGMIEVKELNPCFKGFPLSSSSKVLKNQQSFVGNIVNNQVLKFTLDAGCSTGYDISDYQWQISDGRNNTGKETTVWFDESGEYTISLTVTDDTGKTTTKSEQLLIGELCAKITDLPTKIFSPQQILLRATTCDSALPVTQYKWAIESNNSDCEKIIKYEPFGKETEMEIMKMPPSGISCTYTITLTVKDKSGKVVSSKPSQVEIPAAPIAFIEPLSPIVGIAPLVVELDGSSSYSSEGYSIDGYEWISSCGGDLNGKLLEKTFEEQGECVIKLTVTDSNGMESIKPALVTVSVSINNQPNLSISPPSHNFGEKVILMPSESTLKNRK